MKIVVDSQVHLSELRDSDRAALAEYLNDKDMYERLLRVPFPYSLDDSDRWLAIVKETTEKQGKPLNFAIRDAEECLIGGIGFLDLQIGVSHRAEIGYWLAKPYWGRGIMSAVVARVCQHAFAEFGLAKITAHVFTFNPASARVLEKCGFVQEGLLRKHYLKDGKFIDARLYALFK